MRRTILSVQKHARNAPIWWKGRDSINFCVVVVFAAYVFVATVEQTYLGNPNAIMRDIINNNNNNYYYHYYCDRYSANKF